MHKPSPFRYLLIIIPVAAIVVLAFFVRQQMARIAGFTSSDTAQSTQPAGAIEVVDPGIQKSVDEAIQLLKGPRSGILALQRGNQ